MQPPGPSSSAAAAHAGATWTGGGTLLGAIALASLGCSAAAACRIHEAVGNEPTARIWVALAALAFVPLGVSVLVLRAAGSGVRALIGTRARVGSYAVLVWLGATLLALSVWGNVLRATTHNGALAGVTFAGGSTALAVGIGMLCIRLTRLLDEAQSPATVGLLGAVPLLLILAGLLRLGARFWATSSGTDLGSMIDGLTFGLAAFAAARAPVRPRLGTALVGLAFAGGVVVAGVLALQDGTIGTAIRTQAHALASAVSLVPGT